MKNTHSLPLTTALCLCLSAGATAEVQWNGFLTAGGGKASPDNGDFLDDYEDNFTFDVENIFGLQASADLNDKFSITGQIVAKGIDDYDPEVTWAYLGYQHDENLSFKIGRFRLPFYLYSDFLDVGYAYHFINPPNDVYLTDVDTTSGIYSAYQTNFGDWDATFEGYFGSFDEDLESDLGDVNLSVRDQFGLVATLTYDIFTLRASYHGSETNLNNFANLDGISQLIDALVLLGAQDAADDLAFTEVDFGYSEFGFKIEPGAFSIIGEYTSLDGDSGPTQDQSRWFVSGLYPVGEFTFHLTHSEADDKTTDLSGGIPLLGGLTQPLIDGVNALTSSLATEATTDAIGFRWDFTSSAAFKFEYSKIDDDKDDTRDGKLVRFVIDAVF